MGPTPAEKLANWKEKRRDTRRFLERKHQTPPLHTMTDRTYRTKLTNKLGSILSLLAEQHGKSDDEMATILLAEGVRQSLAGNVSFPEFNLHKLFEPLEDLPTQPSNPPPATGERADWKGRSVYCNGCANINRECNSCEQGYTRPTKFLNAYGGQTLGNTR